MNNNEKRVVSIFKSYIEKLFVPTFKKNDGLTAEWNKMNLLLAN